jgi:hypothetical protein
MLDLLVRQNRWELARLTRERVAARDLTAAIELVEQAVEHSSDTTLIEAACASTSIDLDWGYICAEAVEADVALRAIGEPGCRYIELEIGNMSDRRLDVLRHYYAPDPTAGGRRKGRPAGVGGYAAFLHEPRLKLTGLEPLAAVQLAGGSYTTTRDEQEAHERRRMLAGQLLVLRYLSAAQDRALAEGFPLATQLKLGVERITGEEAIAQLDPVLEITVKPAVRPINDTAVDRLNQRRAMHVAKWQAETNALFDEMRSHFEEHGYIPSRWIPEQLAATYERLRTLEHRLLLHHPMHRMTQTEAASLAWQVREVREANTPKALDLAPYEQPVEV